MSLNDFVEKPSERSHGAYADSVLSSTAPEYATSEVLLGGAYRKLILGTHENEVDLERINALPSEVAPAFGGDALWTALLFNFGGIASPARSGQRRSRAMPQMMPVVPEVA